MKFFRFLRYKVNDWVDENIPFLLLGGFLTPIFVSFIFMYLYENFLIPIVVLFSELIILFGVRFVYWVRDIIGEYKEFEG